MKLLFGVGINDMRGWSYCAKNYTKLEYRIYKLWSSMLQRCYWPKTWEKRPQYKGCTVCERWKKLSNFANDVQQLDGFEEWKRNPNKRIALDKDSIEHGNREYAPEKCRFLPIAESCREMISRTHAAWHNEKCVEERLKVLSKPVICVLPNGEERMFSSAAEAARTCGFKAPNISAACRGKLKTYRGCKFRYANREVI